MSETSATPTLDQYGRDLTLWARLKKLTPVIGRQKAIDRCIRILARRDKNNPLLLGAPGVGKTAVVEGLAMRIVHGDVPRALRGVRLVSIDIALVLAGAKFRGDFEKRIEDIAREVRENAKQIIVFIDELHNIVGAGKAEGSIDAANILKPMLARGEFACIGATTYDEYKQYVEKDGALARRFNVIRLSEPSTQEAIAMLRGIKKRYEMYHRVIISDEAVQEAVRLAERYITGRCLPDTAIDLMDEAAAMKQVSSTSKPVELRELEERRQNLQIDIEVAKDDDARENLQKALAIVEDKISVHHKQWQERQVLTQQLHDKKDALERARNQISELLRSLQDSDLERVAELKKITIPKLESEITELESNPSVQSDVVTQENIAKVVSESTEIPVGELVESDIEKLATFEEELSKRVVGQRSAVRAVSNAVRRAYAGLADRDRPLACLLFVGPSGVGKTALCQALAELLFDDKKSLNRIDMSEYSQEHSVARLIGAPPGYLGYDRGGVLTEAVRNRQYQVILCDNIEKAHTNVHSIFLQMMEGRLTDSSGKIANFKNTILVMSSNLGAEFSDDADRAEEMQGAIEDHFSPEFINRLDEIVIFENLSIDQIKQIIPGALGSLQARVKEKYNKELYFTDEVIDWFAQNAYSHGVGARTVKSLITNQLENRLAVKLLGAELKNTKTIRIVLRDCEITILPEEAQILPPPTSSV
jgi:ATP-dependent Clp protease ATP-binding subunit ClpB